jgi:hypothetical protein
VIVVQVFVALKRNLCSVAKQEERDQPAQQSRPERFAKIQIIE